MASHPLTPAAAWRSRPAAAALAPALVLALCLPSIAAGELSFDAPRFLSGDSAIGASAGMQVEATIARGGEQYLAVWSDGRTSPDDYWPFATEGSGTDIYGVRLDGEGNRIDVVPFVIHQGFGDQSSPQVAWNGESWLVVWMSDTPTLPTYQMLQSVRVSTDGIVLDSAPIVVHDDQAYYDWQEAVVEAGGGDWVALFQANGPVSGLFAVRITADGAVANPGGLLIHETSFGLDFDLAFAGDEYLITWGGSFDNPHGRRMTSALQPIGNAFAVPFSEKVGSDGTDFLIVRASGPPPLATVDAVRVTHEGQVLDPPFTIFTAGAQSGTCCANVTWDGTYFWTSWGQRQFARVTSSGTVVDPGGFEIAPPASNPISTPSIADVPGGGLQLAWNGGVSGADYPKDVYSARVDDAGELANETLVSTAAPAQLDAEFAEGSGVHLLVYRSRASDSGRILAQRIDSSGSSLDAEPIEVAAGPIPGLGVPSIGAPGAAWNGSVFLITWSDGLQIFARRMLPDGSFLDVAPLVVMDGHDPDVAAAGQVFLVVGLDLLQDNPQWQATHSMRVDGVTGQNLDVEPNALGGFAIFARHPHVVGWNGRWLCVWQRNLSHDNPAAGTTAAIVDADGTTPGLIDLPLGWRPDVAVSADRALFAAVTNSIASATTDVEGMIMAADGTLVGVPFEISSAPDKQLRPAVTWNGSEFVVVWEDKRNSVIYYDERSDVYGARVSPGGVLLDIGGVPIATTPVPEIQPAMVSIEGTTLIGVSRFVPADQLGAYRLGIQISAAAVGVGDAATPVPRGIRLLGARPNPARPATTIRLHYGIQAPIGLRLFDADGRLVRTFFDGRVFTAGSTPIDVRWDGRDDAGHLVSSGVYFFELRSPEGTTSDNVVVVR